MKKTLYFIWLLLYFLLSLHYVKQLKFKVMTPNLITTAQAQMQRPFDVKETLQVLGHNKPLYWSWGVSNRVAFQNKDGDNAGLMLKVNGRHHKGYVFITLGWDDVYVVTILSTRANILVKYEGVYVDMLAEVIDERIEKCPDYTF